MKEELRKEVECLRAELKQVRDDRDHSVAQLNNSSIELANCKEQIGKSSKEYESMSTKVSALEVCSCILIFISVAHKYWAYNYSLFIRKRAAHKKNRFRLFRSNLQLLPRS